jgi:hypothetical protein
MSNKSTSDKVKLISRKISFLMPHQEVLPDLKELAQELHQELEINKESPEYLMGAHDALMSLITGLEQKGPQRK